MSDPQAPAGKHALVTGGGRGLGAAISVAMAQAGCRVTINYRSDLAAAQRTADTIRSAGGEAAIVKGDVSEPADVATLVQQARDAFGPIAILVNNAGIGQPRGVFDNDLDDFDETMRVNVRSAFMMTQAVIEEMREAGYGRLVFLSSIAAWSGGLVSTPYTASKAALAGLMRNYALTLRDFGITSNAIAPALVESDMVAAIRPARLEEAPMRRLGRPEEVAAVARLFLECEYMTGQTVHVNAGRYMT